MARISPAEEACDDPQADQRRSAWAVIGPSRSGPIVTRAGRHGDSIMADIDTDTDTDISTDETSELIASNKVEGTAVYDRHEERLGTITNFMVDKVTGQVEYAVLSFGGLFGLGGNHYPLPWEKLSYDEDLGGYVVDIDRETLETAPSYSADEEPAYDRAYGDRIHDHYETNGISA
jgi:hypothetical protein